MLKFPKVPADIEPAPSKMNLREYARFSELCLSSNPAITPQNCIIRRTDEAQMKPFRMARDRRGHRDV